MNDRTDFEAQLSRVFAAYADLAPVEVDAVSLTSAVAHHRKRSRWAVSGRPAWLLVGITLGLLAVGAALVAGASLTRPRVVPGGGGLLLVAQLEVPAQHFAAATAMHVFTLDLATGASVPIVDRPLTGAEGENSYGPATWAAWSPDRTHALVFHVDSGHPVGIVDVASHRLTAIAEPPGFSFALGDAWVAWGPASDRIAALGRSSAQPSEPDLVLVLDLTGREIARLTLPPGTSPGLPSWSKDGSSIQLDGSLLIVPTDGSTVHALVTPAGYQGGAVWSPDGATIAYSTNDGIAQMRVADGRETIVATGANLGDLAWSPDGRRIAYAEVNGDEASQGIHVVDVDGTHLIRLSAGNNSRPDWSPDGSSVVFGRHPDPSGGDGYPTVWIVPAHGGEPRLVIQDATADW